MEFLADVLRTVARRKVGTLLMFLVATMAIAAPIAFIGVSDGATVQIQRDIAKAGSNVLFLANNSFLASLSEGGRPLEEGDTAWFREAFAGEPLEFHPALIQDVTCRTDQRATPENTVVIATGPEYLRMIDYQVEQGRFLSTDDRAAGAPVCVLDEALRAELFPDDETPLGRTVSMVWRRRRFALQVVGVLEEPFLARNKYKDMDTIRAARFTVARRLEFKNIYVPYGLLLPPDRPPPAEQGGLGAAGYSVVVIAPDQPPPADFLARGEAVRIDDPQARALLAPEPADPERPWLEAAGRALYALIDLQGLDAAVLSLGRLQARLDVSLLPALPGLDAKVLAGRAFVITAHPFFARAVQERELRPLDADAPAALRAALPAGFLVQGLLFDAARATIADFGFRISDFGSEPAPDGLNPQSAIRNPQSAPPPAPVRLTALQPIALAALVPREAGRALTAEDEQARRPVCLADGEWARAQFPDGDPLGRTLRLAWRGHEAALEIVGLLAPAAEGAALFAAPAEGALAGLLEDEAAPRVPLVVPMTVAARLLAGGFDPPDRPPTPREEGNVIMVRVQGPVSEALASWARGAEISAKIAPALSVPAGSTTPAYLEDAARAVYLRARARDLNVLPVANHFWIESIVQFTELANVVIAGASGFVMLGVAIVMILVINLIVVRTRFREVAIRRCEGATRGAIVLQFLLESTAVSLAAGVLGGGLGVAGGELIGRNILAIPPAFGPKTFLLALGFALLFGVLSNLVPAWRAARVDPVVILHQTR